MSDIANLSAFQRDLLWALSHTGQVKGLDLKLHLEEYYERPINHAQLYPNLDQLVYANLISKQSLDGRTNGYALTEQGHQVLRKRRIWEENGPDEFEGIAPQ